MLSASWRLWHSIQDAVRNRAQNVAGGPAKPGDSFPIYAPLGKLHPHFTSKKKIDNPLPLRLLITPDSKRIVVVGRAWPDRTSQVWSIEAEPKKLSVVEGDVSSVLPDNKAALRSISSSPSEYVDLQTGKKSADYGPPSGSGYIRTGGISIGVTATTVWDRPGPFQVFEYDLRTGKKLDEYVIGKDNRAHLAPLINNGRELVYCLPLQNTVRVWDLVDRKLVREFQLSGGRPAEKPINHTAWNNFRVSPDGKWIAVNRSHGAVEIFDGTTGQFAAVLPDYLSKIQPEFVPGRDLCVVTTISTMAGHKGPPDLGLFDIGQKKFVGAFRGYDSELWMVAMAEKENVMATGHQDGGVYLCSLDPLK